ncbi:MAG: DUF4159 domain-containing protein [Leeuwenhoekiella sp.]
MIKRQKLLLTVYLILSFGCYIQAQTVAVLQYEGGGDWYGNPTSVPNLISFCNENIGTSISAKTETVKADDIGIMQFPFIHMTGHGNVYFSEAAVANLKNYLLAGGFLHIDDNYGMDQYIRGELKKLFPDKELQEIPADHPIFSNAFVLDNGLPKIHEHDGERPLALGLFDKERLMLLFTTESDLGDGWEDQEVHNDPQEIRLKALQMGANILKYAFEN